MTNLEAMQDEDLRQMIHDVELLERLYEQVKGLQHIGNNLQRKMVYELEEDIRDSKRSIQGCWRELLEVE